MALCDASKRVEQSLFNARVVALKNGWRDGFCRPPFSPREFARDAKYGCEPLQDPD